jgi:polyhydroxybutyrate depolymerase
VWNDRRNAPALARREAVDDVAFLGALIERLASDGVADAGRVSLAGISNGAFLSEHIARHGLLPVQALVLVAGSATAVSRQGAPRPSRPTTVMIFAGTADPLVPYTGGPIGGLGRLVSRRPEPSGARRGVAVAMERVATDWVEANGLPPSPVSQPVAVAPGDPAVTRLLWQAPDRPSVVLYRIDGGGHTWPGGGQYLPSSIIGRVATGLDATGLLLEGLAAI